MSISSSPALGERDDVNGLETWEDPIPRRSQLTIKDLHDAFVAACTAQLGRMPKRPSREERIQERQRKIMLAALTKYAKRNNMQPGELESVRVKEMSLVHECKTEFIHCNFLAKRAGDGEPTMFFAEVKPDCKGEEEDVYHCTPLEETDSGTCFACNRGAEDLVHPTAGGYLGGHKEKGSFHMELLLDSDDDVCYI